MPSLMHTWRASYDHTPRGYSEQRTDAVGTGTSQLSATDEAVRLQNYDRWQKLIDKTLIEMGRNPEAFSDADEGVLAPSCDAIRGATKWAFVARDMMLAAPGQILPDGDGGLTIQHALSDGATESFEVSADGRCALCLYPRAPKKPSRTEIEFADDAI